MNVSSKWMASFIVIVFLVQPLSADIFQNLDFEDAEIEFDKHGQLIQSLAVPFWETNAQFFNYNIFCLGSICTSIHDDQSIFLPQPLEGTYSINLDPGTEGGCCDLSQFGTVPDNATSLTLLVNSSDPTNFQVSLAGMTLTTLSDFPSGEIRRLVYDITSLGGVTGELVISQDGPNDLGGAWVDDIRFVPTVVAPLSFFVTRGNYVSGGVVEFALSDNADLSIQRSTTDVQSLTEFTVNAFSPVATPATFEVTLEGAVFARSTVNQSIELFDYNSGVWEQVDSSVATQFADSTVTVAATGDLSRFVQQNTFTIEARIRYQSTNPRQRFASNTDRFTWAIGQ